MRIKIARPEDDTLNLKDTNQIMPTAVTARLAAAHWRVTVTGHPRRATRAGRVLSTYGRLESGQPPAAILFRDDGKVPAPSFKVHVR